MSACAQLDRLMFVFIPVNFIETNRLYMSTRCNTQLYFCNMIFCC